MCWALGPNVSRTCGSYEFLPQLCQEGTQAAIRTNGEARRNGRICGQNQEEEESWVHQILCLRRLPFPLNFPGFPLLHNLQNCGHLIPQTTQRTFFPLLNQVSTPLRFYQLHAIKIAFPPSLFRCYRCLKAFEYWRFSVCIPSLHQHLQHFIDPLQHCICISDLTLFIAFSLVGIRIEPKRGKGENFQIVMWLHIELLLLIMK